MELDIVCTTAAMVEIEKRDLEEVLRELLAKKLPTDEHVVTLRSVGGGVERRYRVVTGIVSIEEEEERG